MTDQTYHFICEAGYLFADVFIFSRSRILIYLYTVIMRLFARALLITNRFFCRNLIGTVQHLVGSMLSFSSPLLAMIRVILSTDKQVTFCFMLANILSWVQLRTFVLSHFKLIIANCLLRHGPRRDGLLIILIRRWQIDLSDRLVTL